MGLKTQIIETMGFEVRGVVHVITQLGASHSHPAAADSAPAPCSTKTGTLLSGFECRQIRQCLKKLKSSVSSGMIHVCLKALTPFNLCFSRSAQLRIVLTRVRADMVAHHTCSV